MCVVFHWLFRRDFEEKNNLREVRPAAVLRPVLFGPVTPLPHAIVVACHPNALAGLLDLFCVFSVFLSFLFLRCPTRPDPPNQPPSNAQASPWWLVGPVGSRARPDQPSKAHSSTHTTNILCWWCVCYLVLCLAGRVARATRPGLPRRAHSSTHHHILCWWCVCCCCSAWQAGSDHK